MPRYIKQFVVGVVDFSSQYGGENPRSFSYSVGNLLGEPQIFPKYGDYTQAAVMRTYGPWWNRIDQIDSYRRDKRPKLPGFVSEDYIDILFEQPVYPWSIAIYETYNPGALVRILALCQEFPKQKSSSDESSDVESSDVDPCIYGKAIPLPLVDQYTHWEVLWYNANPQSCPTKEARMFAPILRDIKYRSRIIRLEFCHTHLDYYTELDAVELTGTLNYSYSSPVDPPTASMTSLSISPRVTPSSSSEEFGFLESKEDYHLAREVLADYDDPDSGGENKDVPEYGPNGYFSFLPPEIISRIFEYLSFPDFCRAACVCKLFHLHSYDPSQLSSIDLYSHWHKVNCNTLSSITARCDKASVPNGVIQFMNLKWIGGGDTVAPDRLRHFFLSCNFELLNYLSLASSPSVTDFVLIEIAKQMPNLTFLDIQSCDKLTSEGIRELHVLTKLQNLNLYRTKVDDAGIICIAHSNPDLMVLNIGSCNSIRDYDRVLLEVSTHCKNLRVLDMWRAKSLTSTGLNALALNCKKLEELDVGWCGNLLSTSGCFSQLVQSCPCIKKLFLTTNRSVSDAEIMLIAKHCPDLRQLDILGTRLVSAEAVENLLHRCKKMEFIDVSFCFSFTVEVVESLRQAYPHVAIKRSFQD